MGPLSSVPAIGWEAIQEISFKFRLPIFLLISFFTEPVSVKIEFFFKLSFIDRSISLYALSGVEIIIKSASFTDKIMSVLVAIPKFSFFKNDKTSLDLS